MSTQLWVTLDFKAVGTITLHGGSGSMARSSAPQPPDTEVGSNHGRVHAVRAADEDKDRARDRSQAGVSTCCVGNRGPAWRLPRHGEQSVAAG